VRTTLAGLERAVAEERIRPPSVWVVGDVVTLGTAPAAGSARVAAPPDDAEPADD
jgi:uroporphyrin-III C-methyltransferase/precorrin-2 dehydrogenase/sirohydrochlorin ferrochelatase